MKTPIEVAQIKAEALREAADDYVSEKTAIYREVNPKWHDSRINNWLRERADALVAPPVELPTEPTLGWLRWDGIKGTRKRLAVWHLRESDDPYVHPPRRLQLFADGLQVSPETVESFEPVVVLPLRDLHRLADGMKSVSNESRRRSFDSNEGLRRVFEDARTLLAAVDAANGDAS